MAQLRSELEYQSATVNRRQAVMRELRVNRIFSNGGKNDYVIEPFKKLIARSLYVYLAAPYFTQADHILNAINGEMSVQLSCLWD